MESRPIQESNNESKVKVIEIIQTKIIRSHFPMLMIMLI